jgi:hypothetical protein
MAYQPWFNPDLQSIAGLNSAMVFGENIQFATGVNHQIALGSNMQLCVNPGTWLAMMDGPACSALNDFFGAGGLGGNLQFTIGTNTTVNWGRQYQVNVGGETITIEAALQDETAKRLCAIIGGLTIVYALAYGVCPDENWRATIIILFQIAMDAMLTVFMIYQQLLKLANTTLLDLLKKLHADFAADHSKLWEQVLLLALVATTGVVGALLMPIITPAIEEGGFASQQSPPQSA